MLCRHGAGRRARRRGDTNAALAQRELCQTVADAAYDRERPRWRRHSGEEGAGSALVT